MSKEDVELNAMGVIIKELESVPKERQSAVLRYVSERMGVKFETPGNTGTAPPFEETSGGGESIKLFVDKKKPKNNYQAIACLAYYLEKWKGVEEWSNKDIEDANKAARRTAIANIPRDIVDTKNKYGFIRDGSDHTKKILTTLGEKVVEALPDQGAVKGIIKSHRKHPKHPRKKKKV